MDELRRKLIANLQNYLRERQDFVASLPTMDPTWTAPLNIIANIFEPILGSIDNKCPNLFLLFDNIARSENIRAGAIQFEIKIFVGGKTHSAITEFCINGKDVGYKFYLQGEDYPVGIYLGSSGCQAFYSVIENIIRNATRHSKRERINEVQQESDKIIKKQTFNKDKVLKITIEFHFDDEDNKYKEDFVMVRIYDNMGGWEKENDNIWVFKEKKNEKEELKLAVLTDDVEKYAKEILKKYIENSEGKQEEELNSKIFNRKFSPNYPEGRIIDETGKIVEGSWGLKEMRICASFLRGLKISDYDKILEDGPPVIKPFIQPVSTNEGSLGIEFYIPKVKTLLIVSQDEIFNSLNKEDLKNKGIYFIEKINYLEELINKGIFTHEFVLIDINDENTFPFIEKNLLRMPYKLLYFSKDGNTDKIKQFEPQADKKIIKKDELNDWLSNLKITIDGEDINLSIDQKIIIEIYKKWIGYLNPHFDEMKIGLQPSGALNRWEKNNLIGFDEREFNSNKDKFDILFDHQFAIYKKMSENFPICIFPFTRGVGKISKMWKMLIEARHGINYSQLLGIYETLECALTNILIIDERIFESFDYKKNIAKNDVYLAYYWFLQNVVSINLTKENGNFIFDVYEINHPIELDQLPKKIQKVNNLDGILPEHFKNKLHFLIIHRSIIHSSKMGGLEGFKEFLKKLPSEYKPWYVVITSGIGHPSEKEMPPNSKFIHFSELTKLITQELDKFLFLKTITSLKER